MRAAKQRTNLRRVETTGINSTVREIPDTDLHSIGILAAILGLATEGQAAVGVRLLMGINDKSSSKWDGTIRSRAVHGQRG